MKDGIVLQVADPISLYDHPVNRFVAGFIGSPPMNFMEGRIVEEGGKLHFDEGKLKVPIPEEDATKLRAAKLPDGKVTFGIRPEDVVDPEFNRGSSSQVPISAQVEIIEPMGSETYIYLTTGKTSFVARVDSHTHAQLDQAKTLLFNMDKAHYFEPGELGKTLV